MKLRELIDRLLESETLSELSRNLCEYLGDSMTAEDLRSIGCEFIEKAGHKDMGED